MRLVLWIGRVGHEGGNAGGGVESVASAEVVVALAVVVLSVPDGGATGAVAGERVAVDGDGGALVEADAEEFGMGFMTGARSFSRPRASTCWSMVALVKRPKPTRWPGAIMMVLSSGSEEPRTMREPWMVAPAEVPPMVADSVWVPVLILMLS